MDDLVSVSKREGKGYDETLEGEWQLVWTSQVFLKSWEKKRALFSLLCIDPIAFSCNYTIWENGEVRDAAQWAVYGVFFLCLRWMSC